MFECVCKCVGMCVPEVTPEVLPEPRAQVSSACLPAVALDVGVALTGTKIWPQAGAGDNMDLGSGRAGPTSRASVAALSSKKHRPGELRPP